MDYGSGVRENGRHELKGDLDAIHGDAGASIEGRAITATLRVSPLGRNTDGSSWPDAFQTIQAALNAAGTLRSDMTLIELAPLTGGTHYDINLPGDPTWSANVIIKGSHRDWTQVCNTHASSSSVLKLTGFTGVEDFTVCQGSTNHGIILTADGFRVEHMQFVSGSLGTLATSLWLDGTATKHGKTRFNDYFGHLTYSTAIKVDDVKTSNFEWDRIHNCLKGIHQLGANSDQNIYNREDIGDCALGIDIDGGTEPHFYDVIVHHNTINVDDEVGDGVWGNIFGQFPITTEPDDFTGVLVSTGDGADTWTGSLPVIRAATDKLFRVTSVNLEATSAEKFRIRLTATEGSAYFTDLQFEGAANEQLAKSVGYSPGSDYIFNKGTVIQGQTKSESAGVDNCLVWLQIQEI